MKYKLLILAAVIVLIAACNSGNMKNARLAESYVPPTPPSEAIAPQAAAGQNNADIASAPQTDKKKIIKDGSITIRTDDLEKAKKQVDSLLTRFNAYYSSENMTKVDFQISYNLVVRIPSDSFEKFIASLESGEGEVTDKYISGRDVTTEFIDLETRLATKRSYLESYRGLLKQAKSVKEILEIQEQIRTLVEEIESTEGRLKYLSDQVSYSTLNLTLIKVTGYRYRPEVKGPFGERLRRSLSGGWNGFVTFTLVLIRLWPMWIILGIIIPLWINFRKRKIKK